MFGAFVLGRRSHGWSLPLLGGTTSRISPTVVSLDSLPTCLHELEKGFAPFGSNAAHPSELNAHPQFQEAVKLLEHPSVPLEIVLQYAEGGNWALSCTALAALKLRIDRGEAVARVQLHCEKFAAWAMYFALEFLVSGASRSAPRSSAPRTGGRKTHSCRFSSVITLRNVQPLATPRLSGWRFRRAPLCRMRASAAF
jgi:hypothetical protein